MVAFNFTVNIEKIEDGTKLSTIRKTKRCKVGDTMQLYTGQRTKACRKLKDVVCVGTARIKISKRIIWRVDKVEGDPNPDGQRLHVQEGFNNINEMLEFFSKTHGLPFTGYLHAWQ